MKSEEIYKYGKKVLLHNGGCFTFFLIFSMLVRKIDVFLIYTFLFSALRRYAGGYHEKSRFRCMITSFALLVLVILFVEQYDRHNMLSDIIYLLVAFGTYGYIIKFSPIPNKNHVLDEWQLIKYGHYSRLISSSYIISLCILGILGYRKISCILWTVLVSEGVLLKMSRKQITTE